MTIIQNMTDDELKQFLKQLSSEENNNFHSFARVLLQGEYDKIISKSTFLTFCKICPELTFTIALFLIIILSSVFSVLFLNIGKPRKKPKQNPCLDISKIPGFKDETHHHDCKTDPPSGGPGYSNPNKDERSAQEEARKEIISTSVSDDIDPERPNHFISIEYEATEIDEDEKEATEIDEDEKREEQETFSVENIEPFEVISKVFSSNAIIKRSLTDNATRNKLRAETFIKEIDHLLSTSDEPASLYFRTSRLNAQQRSYVERAVEAHVRFIYVKLIKGLERPLILHMCAESNIDANSTAKGLASIPDTENDIYVIAIGRYLKNTSNHICGSATDINILKTTRAICSKKGLETSIVLLRHPKLHTPYDIASTLFVTLFSARFIFGTNAFKMYISFRSAEEAQLLLDHIGIYQQLNTNLHSLEIEHIQTVCRKDYYHPIAMGNNGRPAIHDACMLMLDEHRIASNEKLFIDLETRLDVCIGVARTITIDKQRQELQEELKRTKDTYRDKTLLGGAGKEQVEAVHKEYFLPNSLKKSHRITSLRFMNPKHIRAKHDIAINNSAASKVLLYLKHLSTIIAANEYQWHKHWKGNKNVYNNAFDAFSCLELRPVNELKQAINSAEKNKARKRKKKSTLALFSYLHNKKSGEYKRLKTFYAVRDNLRYKVQVRSFVKAQVINDKIESFKIKLESEFRNAKPGEMQAYRSLSINEIKLVANDLIRIKKYELALGVYRLAEVQLNNQIPRRTRAIIYSNLSFAAFKTHDYDAAICYARKSIETDQEWCKPHSRLLIALKKKGGCENDFQNAHEQALILIIRLKDSDKPEKQWKQLLKFCNENTPAEFVSGRSGSAIPR